MIAVLTATATGELRRPLVSRVAAETELLQCFDAAPAHPSNALTPLHVACTNYADNLRREGLAPEQVVIALKHLLCHGGRPVPFLFEQRDGDGALADRNEVSAGPTKYAQVLKWCIEAYFDDPR